MSSLVRLEYQVSIDDHPNRKSRPDRQGRLDVEVAANDLLSRLIERIGNP
jgi:hypothetical protein